MVENGSINFLKNRVRSLNTRKTMPLLKYSAQQKIYQLPGKTIT